MSDSDLATNDDACKLADWLAALRLHDTALDEQATSDLVHRCLGIFADVKASLECRTIALYTMAAQINGGNDSMLAHVPHICRCLKLHAVVKHPAAIEHDAVDFHRQVVNAISAILASSPDALVDRSFGPIAHYLVQLVSSEDVHIATAACQFWARYAGVPTSASVRKCWTAALLPQLPALIAALMDQMIYRSELAEFTERFASQGDKTLPRDVEYYSILRNSATVALERLASGHPAELLCPAFRPLLEKRIESESWSEKEAAIVALAAFTQGAGITKAMRDSYLLSIPRIVDCYSDPHPLLRSIACLTMPKLVGHGLRGVKDPWSRVLTSTGKATRDLSAQVRSVAIQALSVLLAYCRGRSSVDGHKARLVDALVSAGQYEMNAETQCSYFECVSHLVGRATNSLSGGDMERLLTPIIDAWKSQTWDRTTEDAAHDPNLTIVPFSKALSTIATYGKSLYAPYAEAIFEKACSDINGIIESQASVKEHKDEDGGDLSAGMTSHLISCLDLLSASYDGLAADAAKYASKFHLLQHLHAALTAPSLDARVYQSALALLGHVMTHETGHTDPSVDLFLDIIRSILNEPTTAAKTGRNALWALTHAAANSTASDDHLLGFVDVLVATFTRTNADPSCIINAAWALTSICADRPTHATAVNIITRRDVFLHLSGLLRTQFPRPLEKKAIFANVCRMLTPAADKVPAELWPVLISAVVADNQATTADELGGSDLRVALRSLLRYIRSTLGIEGWRCALLGIGVHAADVLRRRYNIR